MNSAPGPTTLPSTRDWVPETAFGKWFLSTNIWRKYVLELAVADLRRLGGEGVAGAEKMLDVGCGQGVALPLLMQHFQPRSLLGIDIDAAQVEKARQTAAHCGGQVSVLQSSVTRLDLPDNSVDLIFCHQLIHHVAHQEAALRELYRVLAPGGALLLSESCAAFIHTWSVRLLFRHPEGVQKSADQYLALVRSIGFVVDPQQTEASTPWWSLPDFGLLRRLGLQGRTPEVTEVLMVARKPGLA